MNKKSLKRSLVVSSMVACLIIVAGCGPKTISLTEADNGREVSLKAGEQLVISLPGNPSTGYNWEVQNLDKAVLEQVGEAQFESDNSNLVGAGGKLTLTFEAKASGSATLQLVYHRSWETGVDPLQTFSVLVSVK